MGFVIILVLVDTLNRVVQFVFALPHEKVLYFYFKHANSPLNFSVQAARSTCPMTSHVVVLLACSPSWPKQANRGQCKPLKKRTISANIVQPLAQMKLVAKIILPLQEYQCMNFLKKNLHCENCGFSSYSDIATTGNLRHIPACFLPILKVRASISGLISTSKEQVRHERNDCWIEVYLSQQLIRFLRSKIQTQSRQGNADRYANNYNIVQ